MKETREQCKTKIDIDEFRSGTTNITLTWSNFGVSKNLKLQLAPPPQNVGQVIYGYVDCKNGTNFFKLTTC